MEIMDLELRRCDHWEQREGLAAAEVCAKQAHGEPLDPRCGLGLAGARPGGTCHAWAVKFHLAVASLALKNIN